MKKSTIYTHRPRPDRPRPDTHQANIDRQIIDTFSFNYDILSFLFIFCVVKKPKFYINGAGGINVLRRGVNNKKREREFDRYIENERD